MSKRQVVRWCSFRRSIPFCIDHVWESVIDRVISNPSLSYCMRNRKNQNHRRILPNFLLFVWFDTVEFNRLPCSSDMMYDDVVLVGRFCYQSTMFFGIRVLIELFRLVHAHIPYEIDTSKIIAGVVYSAEFPIVCMIWYGWVQSPAVSKPQDVRWCGFR